MLDHAGVPAVDCACISLGYRRMAKVKLLSWSLVCIVVLVVVLVMVVLRMNSIYSVHPGRIRQCSHIESRKKIESTNMFKSWRKGVVTTDTPEVPVNCSKLIAGDEEEIQRVSNITATCCVR